MLKKEVKSEGKGKKKKKKDVKEKKKMETENGEKKPEKPTEKEIFEMKIEQLKQELEEADDILQHQKEALEHTRHLLQTEEDCKISCISHLKRVLQAENDKRMDIQDRLQTERDLTELMERRLLGKFEVSERNSEIAKSLFLQQKMELEGKLSLLEEIRLQRNSQTAHLKKVEKDLAEKISALREKSREEDMSQVDRFVKNRQVFLKMCHDLRVEWQEAFRLRLPVYAKKQLEENVRLRDICERNTEHLLQVQDRSRNLKELQRSLELEEEIQSSVEDNARRRKICQEERLQRLQKLSREIQSANERTEKSSCPSDVEPNSSFSEKSSGKKRHNVIGSKTSSIRECEIEQCRLEDKQNEIEIILKDQMQYKNSLQSDIEASIDRNGKMISVVLRAGKIFQTRCGKISQEDSDFDVLHQIRILLDITTNNSIKNST